MRIVYFLYFDLAKHSGVAKKVVDVVETWQKQGCDVLVVCLTVTVPDRSVFHDKAHIKIYKDKRIGGFPTHIFDWLFLTEEKKQIHALIENFKPDIFYFRYYPLTPFLSKILKKIKTVYEINTDERKEFYLQSKISLKYKFYLVYYLLTSRFFYSRIDAVVSVTHEILQNAKLPAGIKSMVSPNSINLSRIKPIDRHTDSSSLPVLVFMGSANMPWHGVDILLKIAERTIGKLEFEIVGMTIENAPANVRSHGFLAHDEYAKIIARSDVGVSTLAMFRNQMNEACPLKTREYLALGLPVILAYQDTAFLGQDLPWVLTLPNDETGILKAIPQIISFAARMKNYDVPRTDVLSLVDSEILEIRKLEFLKSVARLSSDKKVALG